MPSKHIDEKTWRKVEKETVRAVVATRESIKESEALKILIEIGLKHIKEEDYEKFVDNKKGIRSK